MCVSARFGALPSETESDAYHTGKRTTALMILESSAYVEER